jgi:hypothetical protein
MVVNLKRSGVGAMFFAFALSAMPSLARADGSDEASARALFSEGRKLVDAGNYAEACPKFEDSFRLDPGIGTSFNLADCLERIGRTSSAWARFLDVAAATKLAGQGDRERVARARAAALEPKLVRLVLDVDSPAPGLVVLRDGIVVGQATWGIAVPVDPGEHLVEATAPGRSKWSGSVTAPDSPTTVSLLVPALAPAPADEPKAPPAADRASAETKPSAAPQTRSTLPAIALGSLGTVTLAASAVFAIKMLSENGEAKTLCPQDTCTSDGEKSRHDDLVADAGRDRTIAIVGAGIGGVAVLTAAYLFWRPARSGSTRATAVRVAGGPLTSSLGAEVQVDW